MELQLVSKEVAILAKEVGFINRGAELWRYKGSLIESDGYEIAPSWVEETISRPTQELLAKWLRDIHKIYISQETTSGPAAFIFEVRIPNDIAQKGFTRHAGARFEKYEDGMEDALYAALILLRIIQSGSK